MSYMELLNPCHSKSVDYVMLVLISVARLLQLTLDGAIYSFGKNHQTPEAECGAPVLGIFSLFWWY